MNWSMITWAALAEVAELGLPDHQPVGTIQAVAVLEAQHAGFGQRAVDDFDRGLVGRQMCASGM